jgi:hypothetical protein
VFQAGGSAISFFLGPQLTLDQKLIVLAVMLVLGSIGVFILDRWVHPLTVIKAAPSDKATEETPTVQQDPSTPLITE